MGALRPDTLRRACRGALGALRPATLRPATLRQACRGALVTAAALGALTLLRPTPVGAQAGSPAAPILPRAQAPPSPDNDRGRQLFLSGCSSCHGVDGRGTPQGPTLVEAGAASADFQLSTGRMPLDDPHHQAERKRPAYDPSGIDALTRYVASLGQGPPIPNVDPGAGDLTRGAQLFILNCAACHSTSAAGGSLGRGLQIPALESATPTQIGEAARTGPGSMPVFGADTLADADLNSIARYILFLRTSTNRGGLGLGRVGPLTEGFVVWLVGMGSLLLLTRWIGERE